VEVVASLSQGRTAAAQCGLFTYKSVPVIFEPPCTYTLQLLDRCFFGPLDSSKTKPQHVKSLYIAWRASVCDGVFVSQRVFTLSTATECMHICSPFLTSAKQ